MKYKWILLLLFLQACGRSEPYVVSDKDEELREALGVFNKAFADANITTLQSLITDNYQHTNGNSEAIGKEAWLAYLKKRQNAIRSGKLVVDSYEQHQLKIERSGQSATVTARISVSQFREGKQEQRQYRVSQFWAYTDKGWKRAGFHDTALE